MATGERRETAWEGPRERLDRVLAQAFDDLSRSRLKALVLAGEAEVDGTVVRDPAHKVAPGARLSLVVPAPVDPAPAPENIPLSVVYEDAEVIVVDKPAGLVVHPAPGHAGGTLVNALIGHCGASLSGIGGVRRPGIVHRLDKDTSGLLVAAKTDRAHQSLAAQFADHGRSGPLERAYRALVWGRPNRPHGRVDAPLTRNAHNHERVVVARDGDGRAAATRYALEEALGPASLLRCDLETGRTHQIRVHMAFLGHPLLGDSLYGSGFRTKAALLPEAAREALEQFGRQALHAAVLGFEHPASGEKLRFESALPADMERLLASLRLR